MKMSQIRRRIELCMSEIILHFEMNLIIEHKLNLIILYIFMQRAIYIEILHEVYDLLLTDFLADT
jgi:hypothetical protein